MITTQVPTSFATYIFNVTEDIYSLYILLLLTKGRLKTSDGHKDISIYIICLAYILLWIDKCASGIKTLGDIK